MEILCDENASNSCVLVKPAPWNPEDAQEPLPDKVQ